MSAFILGWCSIVMVLVMVRMSMASTQLYYLLVELWKWMTVVFLTHHIACHTLAVRSLAISKVQG